MVARRQEHTREELTELVVDAAEELGAREGLRGVTMRRLAAAVGYAPNSIYHSVGDMDEVILHLNARTLARLHASLEQRLHGEPTGEAAVMAVVDGYMAFVRAHHRLWSILVDHSIREGEAFPDWYRAALARPLSLVVEVLQPFFPDADDRRRSVAVLWAALHGIASLSLSGKLGVITPEDAPTLAHILVGRYMAGRKSAVDVEFREVSVGSPTPAVRPG